MPHQTTGKLAACAFVEMADQGSRPEICSEMKMQEPHQSFLTDEEETLVTPRFDDEETVVARRVVPLEEVGQVALAATQTSVLTPPFSPQMPVPRRSWALALVVASALVGGGVLGGAGLYLYQRRASSHSTPAAAGQQTTAPLNPSTAASQPTPAPTIEVLSEQTSSPAGMSDSEARPGTTADTPNNAANAPEAEQRNAVDEIHGGSPKHGKKGDRDEEIQRDERRAKHSDSDTQLSRADTDANGDRAARHVDNITIFDRPRRASRRDRARSDSDADRLRRIFEGQP